MNKKLLLEMFAASMLLFATSCSNDTLENVKLSDEATVNFSLGVEGVAQTRAISDGKGADYLVYAVYDEKGLLMPDISQSENGLFKKEAAFNELKETVSLTLAKGQTYTVVFWAQNKACTAYNTDNLTNVTIDYTAASNNDDTRDAFFAAKTIEVTGNAEIDVELKRPFAQLNVGVNSADWQEAVNSNVKIVSSEVQVNNVANAINLLTGKVSGEVSVSYANATIPSDPDILNVDIDKNNKIAVDGTESFHWISMSYLLVNDGSETGDKKALVDVEFTFTPESGDKQPIVLKDLNNVPVQRNYRTNILGKFLTGDVTPQIVITPAYTNDLFNKDPYTSEGIFERVLSDPETETITLTEDLDFGTSSITVNHDVTIDMANYAVKAGGSGTNYAFHVDNCNLTFKNANIQKGGVYATNDAEVTFENGTNEFDHAHKSRYAFAAFGGSQITVKDGVFSVAEKTDHFICAYGSGSVVTIEGGTWGTTDQKCSDPIRALESGIVNIVGGTFYFNPDTWVADGYESIKDESEDVWVVSKKESAE